MEQAMIVSEPKYLTAKQIKDRVQRIQEVMQAVMIEGTHYGTIPGTPKPTLYKPGAEKLMATFEIGVDPREDMTDLSTEDEVRYRVAVKGFNQNTGALLGVGIGECSSSEEKYRWRKPVCDAEFDETPTERKREVWKNVRGTPQKIKQIRMNPVDVANTILKMAKKRALIDMALTVTAASDIFDQDLEDLPEGMEIGANGKPPIQEPKKKQTPPETPPPESLEKPSLTVAVDSVEVKTGMHKDSVGKDGKRIPGKPWTLYIVKAGGEQYNTFSETFGKLAQRSAEEKVNAVITWSQQEKGKKLESITLEEVGEPGSEG